MASETNEALEGRTDSNLEDLASETNDALKGRTDSNLQDMAPETNVALQGGASPVPVADAHGSNRDDVVIEGKRPDNGSSTVKRAVLCFRDGSRKIFHSYMGGRDALRELLDNAGDGPCDLSIVFDSGGISTFGPMGSDLFVNAVCTDFEGLVREVYETGGKPLFPK